MFKAEKILTILLVLVCLAVSLVLVNTVIKPGSFQAITGAAEGQGKEEQEAAPAVDPVSFEPEEGWELFKNPGYAFSIRFPQQAEKKSLLNQKALNIGLGADPETPVWKFEIRDQALQEGTNLLEASVTVQVLRGEEALEQCSEPRPGSTLQASGDSRQELPVVEINGIPFWKDVVEEGVMGELYTLISYRTISQNACYQLTELIHARSPGLFEPGTIEEYDQAAVKASLERIVNTFQFLDVEASFPEVSYPVPKTLTSSVSKASSDQVDGLDVSHWQGDIQWNKVVDAGYVFTFVKATEGRGWLDWKFKQNITEGTAAGMYIGAYHFARPDLGNSGKEEAEYFLSEVGDYLESGYLRPVLDLEVRGDLTKAELSSWVLEWMGTVKNRTGVPPLIYTNLNFINNYLTNEVTEYDLWIAYWSCDPEPSFDIPPTGKWADWSFWQYYGPGGCGSNAGYVPGIETNIDLNIFNGVVSGLGEYDAASPLWVSLTSDAYQAPAPYYADITADVNGDATGPVNFHFWWDCAALGSDITGVEGSCGELPDPDPGSCLQNDQGMRCLAIDSEIQLAEHTYQEIGDYTAKVIVERGEAEPAEDRYKISVYNPLRGITADPVSPAAGDVAKDFPLRVHVSLQTSISGAVQVEVLDKVTGSSLGKACKTVGQDVRVTKSFDFSLQENQTGTKQYVIWARYRAGQPCPITDQDQDDLSKPYTVAWFGEIPEITLQRLRGIPLESGGVDQLGIFKVNQISKVRYLITNTSDTQGIEVQAFAFEDLSNVENVSLETPLPVEIQPGGSEEFIISFKVKKVQPFSLDVLLSYYPSIQENFSWTLQGDSFSSLEDVAESYWGYDYIQALFNAGITTGCSVDPLLYCKDVPTTRAQTAVFLERNIQGNDYTPPEVALSFQDTAKHWAKYWIEALYRDGITDGCSDTNYCPNQDTTRAQMAVFLLRSKYGADYKPPSGTGEVFDDVPQDHWAGSWIEQLAVEGITKGCDEANYCPSGSVSRTDMAVFLARTFDLLIY